MVYSTNPREKVLSEDSYAQFNTKLTIEKFPELVKYRKTDELLSHNKLEELLINYKDYQVNNHIREEMNEERRSNYANIYFWSS